MKVLLFTGSYPPDICGVGDYAMQLATAISDRGDQVQILKDRWKAVARLFVIRIGRRGTTVMNVLYPTAGYGKSLSPHAAVCVGRLRRMRVSTTMHEYSTLSKRARIAARIMFLFSHVIVFTTSFEKNIAVADCPWIARKSIIVPIGSNVPFLQNSMAAERDIDVAYFGHIAPGKGIETFLFVCSRLAWDTSVYLIGATPEQFPVYWQKVVSDCNSKGITVQLNKPLGEVGSLLARCKVALLPFPDGFSMRRGSALAAQANGALVVTTQPHPGSEALCEVAFCCSSEEEMLDKIVEILADKDHKYDSARQKAYDYARQFSWPQIANAILVALSMPVNDAGATLAKA